MQLRYRGTNDDGLVPFYMTRITVDGISSSNNRNYGFQFFTIKGCSLEEDEYYDDLMVDDGYIDDSDWFVPWDNPYMPLTYKYGEIDDEHWLKYGVIRGKLEDY